MSDNSSRVVVKRGTRFEGRVYLLALVTGEPRILTDLVPRSFIESDYGRFEMEARITDPLAGEITVIAEADQTARWHPGQWRWDVAIYGPDGAVDAAPAVENIMMQVIAGPSL